jgi:uncharacterized membrane protein
MRLRGSPMSAGARRDFTGAMTQNTGFDRLVLGAATVATGLIAGTFYIFGCAVMPALARSDDRTYVEVMRNINDVIQNPVFFLSFVGALVLPALAAWRLRADTGTRPWIWAALALYVAAFVVTSAMNVPLNNALASAGSDPGKARAAFEAPWVAWNIARAVLCTAALACLVRATGLRPARQPAAGPVRA